MATGALEERFANRILLQRTVCVPMARGLVETTNRAERRTGIIPEKSELNT